MMKDFKLMKISNGHKNIKDERGSVMVEAAFYFPIIILVIAVIIFLNLVLLTSAGTKAAARQIGTDICKRMETGSYNGICSGNLNADDKNSLKSKYGISEYEYNMKFSRLLNSYGVLIGVMTKTRIIIENGPMPFIKVEGEYYIVLPLFVKKLFKITDDNTLMLSRCSSEYIKAVDPQNLIRTSDTIRLYQDQGWCKKGKAMSQGEFIGHIKHAMYND